jgi:hypothetical protein
MGMQSSRTRTLRERGWVALLLVVVAAGLLVAAGPAFAAPPPTLGLDALQAELAVHGALDGVMKTSLHGTSVTPIPVKVLAVVDGFSWGKLIMFECTDPAVTDIGGIAAGMSGSPIYVDVGDGPRMIGAVSYGDAFTLRGTGLATPIEYMTAIQEQYGAARSAAGASGSAGGTAAKTVRLDRPVVTSSGVVRKLVLGKQAQAAAAGAGTSVMHPLAEAMITGLSRSTAAYKRLAAKLEAAGLTVVTNDSAGDGGATPDLVPGSPAGVSYASGLYGLYVLGTVTYVDGDDVLLFGHPTLGGYGMDIGLGPIQGTLVGADVGGVWPSSYSPYKMMTPADAKGVATQDRAAGELAVLGGSAPAFPVTTHTTVDGGAPGTDLTDLGQWFATGYYPELLDPYGSGTYPGITSAVAAAGLYHSLGMDPLAGSATTTTTVVVNDGTQDYTFTRDNIWDDAGDFTGTGLADVASYDVTTILANALSDPYDTRNVTVKSVDVDAAFSTTRRYAGISDATVARAIHWGSNTVDVTYYHTGSADPQTLHAALDVPQGTSLSGYLEVVPATVWASYSSEYSDGGTGVPLTMAQTKEIVDALPTNGDVLVAYIPDGSEEEGDGGAYSGPKPAAQQILHGDWAFDGGVEKSTASVVLQHRGTPALGEPFPVGGYVRRTTADVSVDVYCWEAGKPEPTEPTTTVVAMNDGGMADFGAMLPGFRHNVLVTAEVGALTADSLPGAGQTLVKVAASTRLTAQKRGGRLTLTARVTPSDTVGSVTFQRLVRGHWVAAGTAKLKAGVASVKTAGAAKVRARFTGGSLNAASAWRTATVK